MPTGARDPGRREARSQTALSAISAGGGGGGGGAGGAVGALIQQAQQQQAQFAKLLQTVQRLQEENARSTQASGQAVAEAGTEMANAIVETFEKREKIAEKERERLEEHGFTREMAELQSKLQREAQREAQAMATDFLARREGMKRFADAFHSKEADFQESTDSYAAYQEDMLKQGFYDSPEGRKAFAKVLHFVDMAEAFGDNHFDDRHLDAAYKVHNENLQRIAKGEDPQDLGSLRIDPMRIPMAQTEPSNKAVAAPGSIPPEKMFEMKLMGGYPMRGVMFNDEPNLGMPEGYSPKFLDMKTMLTAMGRDAALQLATDRSIRGELMRKNQEIVVKSRDRLEPLLEQYNSLNKMFNPMAPGAIDATLREFVDDPDPAKFNDVGRTLMAGSLKQIFGGGSKGESIAEYAMKVFDGVEEPKTPQQLSMVMALESASFNIKTHLLSELQAPGEEGGESLATQLVRQLIGTVGEEGAMELLGVTPGTTQIVNTQAAMQDRLTDAYAFGNRMRDGFWKTSILQQFREDVRTTTKLADVLSYITEKEATDQQGRIFQLIGQQEAAAALEQGVEELAPEGRAESLSGFDASKLETTFGVMDAIIELNDSLGPDRLTEIASFLSGGEGTPETPNLRAYLDQTRKLQERSGYVKAAGKRARFNFDRQQRVKKQAAQQPSAGESLEKGGAPQVVAEQLPPALLGLGNRINRFVERTQVGGAVFLGGREAGERVLRGKRQAEERFGQILQPLFGEGTEKGLTPEQDESPTGPSPNSTGGGMKRWR